MYVNKRAEVTPRPDAEAAGAWLDKKDPPVSFLFDCFESSMCMLAHGTRMTPPRVHTCMRARRIRKAIGLGVILLQVVCALRMALRQIPF